jgi:hypothetical protein
MATNKTYELTAGKVRWKSISLHGNRKACKPWGQKITGTHEKYGVDGKWLDKQTIDGSVHLDVSGLEAGDIIKVSGASHSNKKNAYWRIKSVTDSELVVARMNESEVVEEMENGGNRDEIDELRDELVTQLAQCDDRETLEAVNEVL